MPDIIRQSDNISNNEVLPPEIKIIQGTTANPPQGSKPGQFMNTITNETFDDFEFIYVDRTITRTYWGRETIEDEPPQCWSPDANSNQSADGKDCLKCPYRLDNAASVTAAQRRSRCVIHFTLLGMRLPNWEPFMMRINGISTGEFMRLLSFFKYNPALRNKETGKPDYHSVKVPAKTVSSTTPSGTAYALKFGQIVPLDDKTTEFSLVMSAEMLGQGNALMLPEEGTPDNSGQVENTQKQITESAPPQVRVINQEPAKVLIGYLETDGREIYAGDLVPAGTRVLKEKPVPPAVTKETQAITPKDVGKVETIMKKENPPAPPTTAAPPATSAKKTAKPIDIGSL